MWWLLQEPLDCLNWLYCFWSILLVFLLAIQAKHSFMAYIKNNQESILMLMFFKKKNFLTFLCFGHSKQTLSRLIPGSSCLITHTYVYPWIIQFTYVPFANLQKEEEWHLTIFSIWMPTLRNATRVTLTGTYYWVVLERYVFKL